MKELKKLELDQASMTPEETKMLLGGTLDGYIDAGCNGGATGSCNPGCKDGCNVNCKDGCSQSCKSKA